jgi:hypothetical protein
MRFSIDEYSKRFKMSKEMIHSRMRNKRLNYIIEDGITYIIVPRSSLDAEMRREIHEEKISERQNKVQETQTEQPSEPQPSTLTQPRKTTVGTIIALYQKENRQLKQRIRELEAKIDKLIDDKERMLINERNRIEQVYTNKDEQLKTILELINTKLLSASPQLSTVHDVHLHQGDESYESDTHLPRTRYVELKNYLKSLHIPPETRKTIKRRFAIAYGSDARIIQQNGAFYLDFSKYDYSDLLEH